ncbi:MAG: ATP-binding protein, partial [Burkholderiales bacterium]
SGLVRHQVRLRPVLQSLCDTLDKVYRDKQVRVSFDLPERCYVPIEQGALLELLGNLLENAYRLCLSSVRISVRETLDGSELCVEDDGPGVPPDQRARILQRGERLDRQHPGQGIGLAVDPGGFGLGRCGLQDSLPGAVKGAFATAPGSDRRLGSGQSIS